jgi:hypothetical protein
LPRAKVWQKLDVYEKIIHINRRVRSRLRRIVDRLPEVGSAGFNAGHAFNQRAGHQRARAINPAGPAADMRRISWRNAGRFSFGGQSN